MTKAKKPAIPLRRSLRIRVGVLVSGAVILVSLGFFLFSLQPMVERIAEKQFAAVATQVEASLDKVFEPAEQVLKMSHGWIGDEAPDLKSPDAFNRLFRPVLEVLPQVTSVVAGTSVGEGWMLLQQPDGSWNNRMTDLKRWGGRHLFFETRADGKELQYWKSLDYDPRKRSWYLAAINDTKNVQWTAPYTFFTTGEPGITASTHISLKDGRDFVIGLDLKLRDLSATTMSARVGQNGIALVLTEDLRVLALPVQPDGIDSGNWLDRVLKQSTELSLPPLTDALANWHSNNSSEVMSFRSGSEAWLARMHSYRLGKRQLWIVTLAPEADFSPNWLSVAGFVAAGLSLLLLLVVLFAQQQARRIALPLESLVAASERVGNLDFRETPIEATEIAEIGQLASAHDKMRTLLQHNQQQIASQKQELHNQITALNVAEEKIRESEAHYRLLSENVSDVIWKMDRNYYFTYVSPADERMRGFRADEVIGQHVLAVMTEEGVACVKEKMRQRLTDEQNGIRKDTITLVAQQRCKDSSLIWTESLSTIERDAHGAISGYYGISRDITERRKAEDDLRASETRMFTILENVDACIYLKDTQGRYLFANRAARDLWQIEDMADIVGFGDEKFFDTATATNIRRNDSRVLEEGETVRIEEVATVAYSGKKAIYQTTKLPLRRDDESIYALCGISTDITSLKEQENQLKHIAHYDVLTTLPNRVLLADRMNQAMIQAQRRGQKLAVFYLDLDGFKAVNDHHGHDTGDQLLIVLAGRMKQALREGDTLARLGGDEFIAVLLDLSDVAASIPMIARLLAAAAEPVCVGESILQVSASLGVTFYPQTEEVDADQLLRQADQAMYQAKLAGKNRYHIFDAEQDRSVRGHHESLEHIRQALIEREFVLHYQPKVNMRTGMVIGAEALIRWRHPERGLLLPAVFLPVIEDHPLAVEVGEWVIDTALSQMELWLAKGLDIPVSVNVGARQLQQADFVDRLREILAAHPAIRPGNLEMEVLETSALEDLARVSEVIESCREIGVLFSLDDFGTGYSSLTYLKRLSVNQLKIDQSFVRDMLDDPDDLAILGGVLSLASAFRRQVIAEGVETVAHGTMLLQLGCELAQGYGIARPMPSENFPDWASAWCPDAAWSNVPPVRREDLPMIFSSVEHRSWVAAVEAFLRGQREALPLIHHQCRFSTWLETEGQIRHGEQATFKTTHLLHHQVHALAVELCELHARGGTAQALTRLNELHDLRDTFIAQLALLARENRG